MAGMSKAIGPPSCPGGRALDRSLPVRLFGAARAAAARAGRPRRLQGGNFLDARAYTIGRTDDRRVDAQRGLCDARAGNLGEDDMKESVTPRAEGRAPAERSSFDRRARDLQDTLRRVAMSLAKEAGQAEELVQKTLIRMWQRQDGRTGAGSYRAWAVAIMRNIWKDELRRSRRRLDVPLDECLDIPDPGADLEAERWAHHRADVLRAALDRIDARERKALLAHHVDGWPLSKVGRALGTSSKTAERLVRRACRRLRSMDDVLELVLE